MSKRTVLLATVAAALVGVMALSSGCCGLLSAAKNTSAGASTSDAVLSDFFKAVSKSGSLESSTVGSDGKTSPTEKVDFWVEGRKLRLDFYRDGALRVSIRSEDGVTAYFCYPDKKVSEPSVATPDVYLRKFTKPDKAGEPMGTDTKTGADRIRYTLRETSNVPGSSNSWYVEDLVYSIKSGRIVSIVERGGVPHEGESTKLDTSTYAFTRLETGGALPVDTFKLPYPVKPAS